MHDVCTPVVVLSSGGKDSLFMLQRLREDPGWDVRALLTTVNEANGRVAMHGTPEDLIREQADALGVPLTLVRLPENCDNNEYEKRLAAGLKPFRANGIEHVACGDLFLADIRQWRETLFTRLGWQSVFPLWQEPTDRLAQRLIEQGWQLTITCVDTQALPEKFLGRRFDQALLGDLPTEVDPCGENGEFHSFVHGGPGFKRPLRFSAGRTVMTHGRFAMLELLGGFPVG
ncbi:MAG: hypothetical protein ACNA7J_00365 [Wenzhouxiangella sp.]